MPTTLRPFSTFFACSHSSASVSFVRKSYIPHGTFVPGCFGFQRHANTVEDLSSGFMWRERSRSPIAWWSKEKASVLDAPLKTAGASLNSTSSVARNPSASSRYFSRFCLVESAYGMKSLRQRRYSPRTSAYSAFASGSVLSRGRSSRSVSSRICASRARVTGFAARTQTGENILRNVLQVSRFRQGSARLLPPHSSNVAGFDAPPLRS